MAKPTTAYTTRKFPKDALRRMRVLAAVLSQDKEERVTMETVLNEVIARGLPVLEKEAFDK
jgi:hypothetical protein